MKRSAGMLRLVLISAILTLLAGTISPGAQAQTTLILTDNSGVVVNGGTHVSDLIAAFTNAGATVTTNSTELTNGSAMAPSLVSGWDVVIVVTVSGTQIDASDIPVLQNAVSTLASSAFLFFTDACAGCTRGSATAVLPIVDAAGGWSTALGVADNSGYVGSLTGAYSSPFAGLPTIAGTAYSPLFGVPLANVIYWTNAPSAPGPSAVVAPGTANSACVFMATDVTPFWVTGGISQAQADGLAAAYLNAAMDCPLQPGPIYLLNVTTVGVGSVTKVPDVPSYPSGTVVQLTATPALAFSGWSGDASGSANPLIVTMNSDKNITATFTNYSMNVTIVGGGSVTKTPNQPYYPTATVVQLTAVPMAGCVFLGWSGDATGSTNPLNVTMNSDKNITATFSGAFSVQHDLLFQDTFPFDGTLTGKARADMARDILPADHPTILPGDSAVVQVSDPVGLAIDPSFGGAAVYLWARVSPSGQPGKTGAALTDTPSRFPYTGSQAILGNFWYCIRMDSCRVNGYAVPNRFCVDLNDNLFTPGDIVWYFLAARNSAGITSYYSRTHDGNGHDFTTLNLNEAAGSPLEFTILPAGGTQGGGDILYVDGVDDRGEDAQLFFDTAFEILGIGDKVDRYDVLAPASASANRLSSRVPDVITQLSGFYRKIIWDTGDHSVTLGDGSGVPEKTDDYALLVTFLNNLPNPGGVYLCGDDIGEQLNNYAGPGAVTFKSTYLTYTLSTGNHEPVYGLSPIGKGTAGNAFNGDTFITCGDCPAIHDFDVMAATGSSKVQLTYGNPNSNPPTNGAIISKTTTTGTTTVRVLLSGFPLENIRDDESDGALDRAKHLYDIITWLGNVINQPTGIGPQLVNHLAQNYPNPFNPQTTIAFSMKERARVKIAVYNVAGELVKTLLDETRAAGSYRDVRWDGRSSDNQPVASGIYFYKLVMTGFSQTRKMVLLK
jgi:hypothetical protein